MTAGNNSYPFPEFATSSNYLNLLPASFSLFFYNNSFLRKSTNSLVTIFHKKKNSDYYTAEKGTGLSFQNLTNYALSTTYGTIIAGSDGKFSPGNSALDNSHPETGASYVRPRFGFNPAFNPGNTATGGALESEGAVGNLVGYDPARGSVTPWQPGNDPEYIKWSYPDSANTATTVYNGVKSYNNAVVVDIYEKPLQTILATANQQGKSTNSSRNQLTKDSAKIPQATYVTTIS